MKTATVLAFLLLLPLCSLAEIHHVPDEFETIQGAIDATEDGDTVLVAPGEYVENINFNGRNVIVMGNPDNPDEVVINGDASGTVAIFENGENEDALLTGFVLRSGSAEYGGGVRISGGATPGLSHLVITDNHASEGGGAVYIEGGADLSFNNLDIRDNSVGAIWVSNSQLELNDSNIENNEDGRGTAVNCLNESQVIFNRVDILSNTTQDYVINIEYAGSRLTLTECNVIGNSGIDLVRTSHSVFEAYRTLFLCEDEEMESRVFRFKWDSEQPCLLEQCTIVGFQSNSLVDATDDGICLIQNTIFFNNNPWVEHYLDGNVTIRYSLCERRIGGHNNIFNDPLFVDPDNDDYHLTADSPCIDAGDPESPVDPDGTPADMGAFYFHQRDIEVDSDELVFEPIDWDAVASQPIIIRNTGNTDLLIEDFPVPLNPHFFYIMEELPLENPIVIPPDSVYTWWIYFNPRWEDRDICSFQTVYTIESNDPDEEFIEIPVSGDVLSVDNTIDHPSSFALYPAFPNPFNSTATISYSLPVASQVSLKVFDLSGREVKSLAEGYMEAGNRTVSLSGDGLTSGVYLVRMESGRHTFIRKILLVR